MVTQKQAVTNAVLEVKPDFELGGDVILGDALTSDDKARMKTIIVEGFLSGKVEMSQEGKDKYFSNPSELGKYTVGLINNWIRKNPEFNAGGSYTPKNPGSRQGTGDDTVKALRALLKITSDASAQADIQSEIDKRLAELKPKVEINISALPEHLRYLVN
jgi:hypothetical protein